LYIGFIKNSKEFLSGLLISGFRIYLCNLFRRDDLIIGEVPEWSIGAVSKTVEPFGVPRVRIPLSPQKKVNPWAKQGF
jgi:hypothetical protein